MLKKSKVSTLKYPKYSFKLLSFLNSFLLLFTKRFTFFINKFLMPLMPFKRSNFNQFVFLILTSFFCLSCSKILELITGDSLLFKTNSLTGNNSFEIYRASINRNLTIRYNNPWEVPKFTRYTFTVCLKEKVTKIFINNHLFKISSIDNPEINFPLVNEISSNLLGCITWNEKFTYNFFAPQSKYVQFNRLIESQNGKTTWTFFINPFAQDRGESIPPTLDSINDPRKHLHFLSHNFIQRNTLISYERNLENSPRITLTQDKENSNEIETPFTAHIRENPNYDGEATSLVLGESVNITPSLLTDTTTDLSPSSPGLRIQYHLDSELFYRTLSNSGNKIRKLIETGKYRLEASLLEKNRDNQCLYSSLEVQIEHSLENQKLDIFFNLLWQYTFLNDPKELYLALKITPIDLPNDELKFLKPYEGFLILGNSAKSFVNKKSFIASTAVNNPCGTLYERNDSELPILLASGAIIPVLPFEFADIVKTDADIVKTGLVIKKRNESASIHQWNLELTLCLKLNERINNPPVNLSYYEATISTAFDQRYLERLLFKPLDEAQIIPSSGVDSHRNHKNLDKNGCLEFYTTLRHKFYMHDFPHLIAFKADMPDFPHHKSITFLTLPSHEVTTDNIKQVKATELPHSLGTPSSEEEETQKQMITFTADKNEIRVIDKGVKSYPIDRFLNFHIKIEPTLSLEPGVRIPTSYPTDTTTEDGFIEYKNLRQGIYLLRSAFINFFREPLISDSENINPLYSIAEENNHLYTSEELTYIVGQGNISQTYSFNFRDPRLNALRNHLLIQYQMVNEKKMILAFYLAKIYGLIPHKLNNKLNLDSFPSTTFKAAHDYSKNPNDGEKKALKDVLKQSTGLCSSEKAETAEEAEEAETAFKKNQCDKRLKALESFLTEISKNSSDSNFDLLTKQHKNINSFLNDYIDCNENSPFHYTIFCKNRNSIKEALEKTLALQKGHKYQVIDNFEKVRNILKKYLGFNESTLNSNDKLLELTSHIYDKDEILLLLLKIIDKSFAFLPITLYTSTQANNTFNHPRNVDIIINEIKKLENYEILSELLYKDSDLKSPVYWTPFIPSKRYSLNHIAPIYPLSALCQKDEENCNEIIHDIQHRIPKIEMSEEEIENLHEQDKRIYQIISETESQVENQINNDISPELNEQSQEMGNVRINEARNEAEAPEPILVNGATQSVIAQAQAQVQSQGQDYMDFLFRKGKENQAMYDISMCYSMLRSLAFFNLKYISLHKVPPDNTNNNIKNKNNKEEDSLLDIWCKEKISKSLNDFYSIYNRNSNYVNNPNIDENTKKRMNKTKELIQSLGFKIDGNSDGNSPDLTNPPDSTTRFNLINNHFNLPHENFLTNLQKKLELAKNQNTEQSQENELNPLDEVILNNPAFKTYKDEITLTHNLRGFIKNMIQTFNPRLDDSSDPLNLNINVANFYLPIDFSGWNVHPNLVFSLCWRWVENVTINNTLFNNHFNNNTEKKEKLEEVMLDCLKSFKKLKSNASDIHENKPYIIEKQKRIFEVGTAEHILGLSQILLLYNNQTTESADHINIEANISINLGPINISAGLSNRWYLLDINRKEERLDLSIKRTILHIPLKKYETCLTFFKNPHYKIWGDISDYENLEGNKEDHFLISLLEALPKITMTQIPLGLKDEASNFYYMKGGGFMVCDEVSTEEIEVREHYFYVEGLEADRSDISQNPHELENRPWAITIRGQDTFNYFFQSFLESYRFKNSLPKLHMINATERPNELAEILKLFKKHNNLLSSPGIYKEWYTSDDQLFIEHNVLKRNQMELRFIQNSILR